MHWFGYSVFVTEFFRAMKIVSCFAGTSWFLLTLKRIKQTLTCSLSYSSPCGFPATQLYIVLLVFRYKISYKHNWGEPWHRERISMLEITSF